jgi:tetratricopeptide (TPR) repeat protein/tRNA A-37 threonylcarbamoyl transferase component Bud32
VCSSAGPSFNATVRDVGLTAVDELTKRLARRRVVRPILSDSHRRSLRVLFSNTFRIGRLNPPGGCMIGETILHYQIEQKIGAGGMGVVYRARDTKLNRDVALKILPADIAKDPERRKRFEREAQTVAALKHPNIVTVYSVEMAGDTPFLTMELVEGNTLSVLIPPSGLSLEKFFELAVPLVDAVAGAHAKGITHRDLKPANVMVDEDGRVKVLDFGLAKLLEPAAPDEEATLMGDTVTTGEGKVLGTASYMSPEQAEGNPVDQRSDIFSLGICLYEMATGQRPFKGDSSISVLNSILKDTPPPVTQAKRLFPRALDRIIQHCLVKEPDRRFQSALDIRNEMESLKKEIDSGELEGRSAVRSGRISFARLGIGAAVVALLIAGITLGPGLFGTGTGGRTAEERLAENAAIGVIGFENLSDPGDADHLGRMLMGLITTDLAETGGLKVVTTPRILSALKQAGGDAQGTFDAAVAGKAATLAGAEIMLVGQILQKGGRLLLTAELADVKTGNTLGSLKKEAASEDDLFALAGGIAEEVRARLVAEEAPAATEAVDLTEILTDSPQAYRYYALGEVALNRQEWVEAGVQFDRAIREDPTFAMAYYRKAIATWWVSSSKDALVVLKVGEPQVERLPRHWQTLYRGVEAYFAGDDEAAYQTLTQLVETTTENPDALYLLGELCVHSPRHLDMAKARDYFERVLEIDPTFTLVLYHLIEEYLLAEDLPAVERAIARCRAVAPDDPVLVQSELSLLNARGQFQEAIARANQLKAEGYTGADESLLGSLIGAGEREKALDLGATLASARTTGIALRADAQTCFGQFRAAAKNYEKAGKMVTTDMNFAYYRALTSSIRLLTGDVDGAIAVAESSLVVPEYFPGYRALGQALQMSGRESEVDEVSARLGAVAEALNSNWGAYWVDLLGAYVHLWRGEMPEAETSLDAAFGHPTIHRDHCKEWILRGKILDAKGDAAGAADAYARAQAEMGAPYWMDYCDVVMSIYLRSKAEEKAGDTAAAREHYRQFLNYWGEADISIPEVDDAKARLAVLESGL